MALSESHPSKKIRVLTFTSLYPNREQQRHGIFVETRMKELIQNYPVEITVVAPIPWFPIKHKIFGQYGVYAAIPKREIRHGMTIHHPRYLVIPKIGMNLAPLLMALSLWPTMKKLQQQNFDLIDAHFIYPDGVVAVLFSKILKLPSIITARGNDITLYPHYWLPRRLIIWAVNQCSAVISVCRYLSEEIKKLGVMQNNNLVMRNGVDLERFSPRNRDEIRAKLKLNSFTLISVGHFIERKGHHFIIEALTQLPDVKLILIGDGPMDKELRALAIFHQVEERVIFTGAIKQEQLADYYSAADCMVLASSREGWANVLLESMACGTPVVATAVSGTPEVVLNETAGQLISDRSAAGITSGIQALRQHYPDRGAVREYANNFDWQETTAHLYELIHRIHTEHKPK